MVSMPHSHAQQAKTYIHAFAIKKATPWSRRPARLLQQHQRRGPPGQPSASTFDDDTFVHSVFSPARFKICLTLILHVVVQRPTSVKEVASTLMLIPLSTVLSRGLSTEAHLIFLEYLQIKAIFLIAKGVPEYYAQEILHVAKKKHYWPWNSRCCVWSSTVPRCLDRKLEMSYVASHIADAFSTDLFVIWSEDNSEKLIIRCRSLMPKNEKDDGEEIQIEEDQFLRQIENTMLNNITLQTHVWCLIANRFHLLSREPW